MGWLRAIPGGSVRHFLMMKPILVSHYLLAQINSGHYSNTMVLSPDGIDALHAPAAPTGAGWEPHTAYAMGWYNGTINGVPAIYHGGDSLNFHSDIFIEPQNSWGLSFC